MSKEKPLISIILPCLNEEDAIFKCLSDLRTVISNNSLGAEVIVVDNGSTDKSIQIAERFSKDFSQLKIIVENDRGYGNAYKKGLENANGDFIYMADCDDTYDFNEIPRFIEKLRNGFDLVVGNRFSGQMEKGAMTFMKRYIGNPALSFLTRLFFGIRIHDIHCGARAISRSAYKKITLYTAGMEFASEMIVKAARSNLVIGEIPIKYRRRIGQTKLEAIGDGWRHLRFLLLYSPLFLFLLPGIVLFISGIATNVIMYIDNPVILGVKLFFHPMFLFSAMTIIGYQLILFSMFSKIYAITHLGDKDKSFEKMFKIFSIERAGFAGAILAFAGLLIYSAIFYNWIKSGFGSLDEIKNSIVSITLLIIGVQTFFSAFMLSTLGIREINNKS